MAKLLSKSQGRISKLKGFCWQKSIICNYCIKNFEDRMQVRVYKINMERVAHFSQFISVKVSTILKKRQA